MSDTAIAILAVAAVVIVALFLLRDQIKRIAFKAGADGVEADIETRENRKDEESASVRITENKLIGKRNRIDVERDDVKVADNVQLGEEHEIRVASDRGRVTNKHE